jgi:hypothetical protein
LHIENIEEIKMSNWISTIDKKPEINKPILCIGINEDGEFLAPNVCTLHDNGKYIIGYQFNSERAIGFYIETYVSHWMELPENPKE